MTPGSSHIGLSKGTAGQLTRATDRLAFSAGAFVTWLHPQLKPSGFFLLMRAVATSELTTASPHLTPISPPPTRL